MLAFQSWRLVREEMSWGEFVIGDVPLWLAHAVLPLAFFLISYRFLIQAMQLLSDIFRNETHEAG